MEYRNDCQKRENAVKLLPVKKTKHPDFHRVGRRFQ